MPDLGAGRRQIKRRRGRAASNVGVLPYAGLLRKTIPTKGAPRTFRLSDLIAKLRQCFALTGKQRRQGDRATAPGTHRGSGRREVGTYCFIGGMCSRIWFNTISAAPNVHHPLRHAKEGDIVLLR